MAGRNWLIAVALVGLAQTSATAVDRIPLNVLYLARNGDEDRTHAFEQLFSQRFQSCTVEQRESFRTENLDGVDVVILDWSQSERSGNPVSPVGPLEEWSTPTVFLGSAGLLMADAWHLIGDAG
jgi:hypothetical protein